VEDEAGRLLAFGLLVTLVVVAFPLSWVWALITLFLPVATLVLALRHLPRPPRWWWWLLGASMFLLNIELVVFLQFHGLETLQVVSPTLGLLLFVGAQAYLLARQPEPQPEPQPELSDAVAAGSAPAASERATTPALPG
jgi:hypothetical protein